MSKSFIYIATPLIIATIILSFYFNPKFTPLFNDFKYYCQNIYYEIYHPKPFVKVSGKTEPFERIIFDNTSYSNEQLPPRRYIKANKDGEYEIYLMPGYYNIQFEDDHGIERCYSDAEPNNYIIENCLITVRNENLFIDIYSLRRGR